MYKIFTIKRYFEQIVMFPFIMIGKLIGIIYPLKEEYDIYFFFPGFAIGGAERVNAEIIKSFDDKRVVIFFTKNSPNEGMKHFFQLPHVTLKEINRWTDNKYIYWANLIYRGICSYYINNQKLKPVVFIGQCNFAYKLTPHIKRDIKIHELIHMFDKRFTWVWAPFVHFLDTRIILGQIFKKIYAECYQKEGIPVKYLNRFTVIINCLEFLPEKLHLRKFDLPLKVYYAGRGGPQKRLGIIVNIIKKCRALNIPVEFSLAGSFINELPTELIHDGTYVGELKGGEEMYTFHKKNDILLMTSAWEGFPMVIMEAMAFGAVALVTNIDAIPEHIKDGVNGFLLNNVDDEMKLVEEAVTKLEVLTSTRIALCDISFNAFQYAVNNFSSERFTDEYRKVVLQRT